MKKTFIISLVIILAFFYFYYQKINQTKVVSYQETFPTEDLAVNSMVVNNQIVVENKIEEVVNYQPEVDFVKEAVNDSIPLNKNLIIPADFDLPVPFISQAPKSDWSEPYQNACEEASLIMSFGYFFDQKSVSKEDADQKILAVVDWEKKYFGFYESTTAEEVVEMSQKYFNLKAWLVYDVSVESIQKELVQNRLVVLPLAGQEIDNPNFTPPGPVYHMLVVRGWNKWGEFITNDPGTRKGEKFKYKYDDLLSAVYDWNKDDIHQGKRVMIVVGQ